ncbi:MAG TPA: DUF6119 family protein [Bryobacteraceae bacterium]
MQLKIYLFRREARSFDDLMDRRSLLGSNPYLPIAEKPVLLPFPYRAYVQVNAASTPAWLRELAGIFDTQEWGIANHHSSFVLLFQSTDRFFAVSYGRGFQALNRELLEEQFALSATLSAIDTNLVKRVVTRTIAKNSRHRTTEFAVGTPLNGFGIEAGTDSVLELHGSVKKTPLIRTMGGRTSLGLAGDFRLTDLSKIGSQLLRLLSNSDAADRFGWLFPYTPLSASEVKKQKLPDLLQEAIIHRSSDLAVAAPEDDTNAIAVSHRLQYRRKKIILPGLDMRAVYAFLDDRAIEPRELSKVYVEPIDADGNPCHCRRPVVEYLVGEWQCRGQSLAFLNGAWFRLSTDRVKFCRKFLEGIRDLTNEWNLPQMRISETEKEYNGRIALQREWMLLDRHNFSLGERQRAEICDLVTPQLHLVCLKRMTASSALSHLFAQASVSADLFRSQPGFRSSLEKRIRKQWPKTSLPQTPVIVYAIPSSKPGPLWKTMYGFSVINLVNHIDRIRQCGFEVMLCGITESKSQRSGSAGSARTRRSAA